MADRPELQDRMYQSDVVAKIAERFGEEFTYENENGNPAIDKRILRAFKKITDDTAVSERRDFADASGGKAMWRAGSRNDLGWRVIPARLVTARDFAS